jgi:hypothetical protein
MRLISWARHRGSEELALPSEINHYKFFMFEGYLPYVFLIEP